MNPGSAATLLFQQPYRAERRGLRQCGLRLILRGAAAGNGV